MSKNSPSLDLGTWVKHHADNNFFEYNGEIIDSEKAFNEAGLHSEAKPSYQEWVASRS